MVAKRDLPVSVPTKKNLAHRIGSSIRQSAAGGVGSGPNVPRWQRNHMSRSRAMTKADRRRPIALPWSQPDADDCLRDTGIILIGRIPWGTHLSLFCDTEQDLLDAACAYFAPAQHAQEHCIWVVSDPLRVNDAVEALRATVPGFERQRKAGQFEVLPGEEWYYQTGQFDWQRIVRAWQGRVDHALANGLAGLRAFGNPLWRTAEQWRDIEEYEHALETAIAGRRVIVGATQNI